MLISSHSLSLCFSLCFSAFLSLSLFLSLALSLALSPHNKQCHSEILNFQLSGPLCDALDKCYVLWHKGLSGDADKERASRFAKRRWRPWRNLAKPGIEKKKDDPDALGNNYDGRNHVSRWNW